MITKMITVTQKVEVPDCYSTLEAGLYHINEVRTTNITLEEKIKELSKSRLNLIVKYCESVLNDIIKFEDNQIKRLLDYTGVSQRAIRNPDGHEYKVAISRIADTSTKPNRTSVKLSLSNGSDTYMEIRVFHEAPVSTYFEDWLYNSTEFFSAWDTFKNLINQLINDVINKNLEREKEKERKNTELLNILDNFKI